MNDKKIKEAFAAVPHAEKLWFNEKGEYFTAPSKYHDLIEVERPEEKSK